MTLARIFVNYESSRMYELLFSRLFDLIHQQTGRRAQWRHLHGQGFQSIVTDMDSKQVAGMRYDNHFEINAESFRDWAISEQLGPQQSATLMAHQENDHILYGSFQTWR
jgi:hypothetical protein